MPIRMRSDFGVSRGANTIRARFKLCGGKGRFSRWVIDEAAIDGYKQRRTRQASRYGRPVSPASVNRELATLRRLLRLAQGWKVLDRVPRIRLLRGERNREFVLSHGLEPTYLKACPQPLRDVAILILEACGRAKLSTSRGRTCTCNRLCVRNSGTSRYVVGSRGMRSATSA